MTDQSRVWKVLVMLLASMTVGTVVLMSLGNTPPVSGAFSLSSYYKLTPMSKVIASTITPHADRWEQIEITYSKTRYGDIEYLANLDGHDAASLNAHFVVCNGLGDDVSDGQILSTERWQKQQSAQPQWNWGHPEKTISIVIVANPPLTPETDYQMSRVKALVEALSHRFGIRSNHNHIRHNSPSISE
jgi:hypothetical protein